MATPAAEIDTAAVVHVPEIGSTNEEALARARNGETGPLFIRADRQTRGRGRHGRSWDSPVGNLHVSLLVPVSVTTDLLPQLSHVAAVALARAIRAEIGPAPPLSIKWPNDILIGRAKTAGILVEATRTNGAQICVIGWGVNCAHHPVDLPYAATDLTAAAGRPIAADSLFRRLRGEIGTVMQLWRDGQGFQEIRHLWMAHALPVDTVLRVNGSREPVTGRFQGIDKVGRLLLLGPDGPLSIEAGDVILDEQSAALAG